MPHNITATFLQKAATDAGLEIPAEAAQGGWFLHRSCRFSLSVWSYIAAQGAVVALSKGDVLHTLRQEKPQLAAAEGGDLPAGVAGAVLVGDNDALYAVLARIVQLELSLPHRLAEAFVAETADMPQETETERWVVQRIGQGKLRAGLLEYWDNTCAVSGLTLREVLRASHIKPWSACDGAQERLNIYNALLLAPHLDVLFNDGYMTFADDGAVRLSPLLTAEHCGKLGVDGGLRVSRLDEAHLPFLHYHRERVFKE